MSNVVQNILPNTEEASWVIAIMLCFLCYIVAHCGVKTHFLYPQEDI